MGNFFRILADGNAISRWYLKAPLDVRGDEIDSRLFTQGKFYDGGLPVVIPLRRFGEVMDVTFADFDMLVVTTSVIDNILNYLNISIQRFPVCVDGKEGFEIVNPLMLISCVDESGSEIIKWNEGDGRPEKVGQFRMITKLKINDDLGINSHLFRVAGWPIALIVSAKLKQLLEKFKVSGIVFAPV